MIRTGSAAALAAMLLACAACGASKKPAPVGNVATDEPVARSPAEPEPAGDARTIQRTQNGGTLELIGNRDSAMTAAEKQMATHCGAGQFTITQEGEEVVGDPDAPTAQIAWRVYYSCTGAVPPAAP